jgi:hypothetical protein
MRQEHVSLQNVQVSQLYDLIKKYLEDLKLEIIHEEKYENYWSLKAHKGGKGSVIIGNVREVEVMISGADSNYDLILRTGAWGRDIIVPAAIASVFSLGVGAAVAGVEAYTNNKAIIICKWIGFKIMFTCVQFPHEGWNFDPVFLTMLLYVHNIISNLVCELRVMKTSY